LFAKRPIETFDNAWPLSRVPAIQHFPCGAFSVLRLVGQTLAVEGRCLRDIPYFLPATQYSDAKKETHFAAGALGT
jgi:hypothetical protein